MDENISKGYAKLKQIALKLIDSATLRAKTRRTNISLSNGITIRLAPTDISYISVLISSALISHNDNIIFQYVDDINLELRSIKVSSKVLISISSFLANLSLRIDLKAAYRLSKLKECETNEELTKFISEINSEEEVIETEYLEH